MGSLNGSVTDERHHLPDAPRGTVHNGWGKGLRGEYHCHR